jgi:kexin
MVNGVQNGREGLGSIYVFASGNGAQNEDNCNFDGYTNSIYSITVGAIDRKGAHPYYSEKCSAGLVVTYSSGSGDAIHTTDVGQNVCSNSHGGTSAAAPLAAGIFALVLQVRPDLSWRDMQYLAMDTAVPINLDSGDWQDTAIGKKFSHTYGYGKLDSYAIVEAAKNWKKVKPQAWFYSPWIHVNQSIPQGDQGVAVGFEVTKEMLKEANLERVEHITVTMNVEHGRRGDLSVDLISPSKVVSHLSVTRKYDDSTDGYDDWTFMSVAHW